MASPFVEKLLDPEMLVRLNGAFDGDSLRVVGRLTIPNLRGQTVTFDLTESFRNRDALVEEYWRFHPRYAFVKGLPLNARLADFGAGSGGTIGWKSWGAPNRNDILMYAIDRIKGEHFDRFIDYDIVDFEVDETKYPDDAFDAVLCSRVIEFVRDRGALAREAIRICRPGGRIYVEWPNADTNRILTKFALSPFGIPCGTLSIEDDPDQVAAIDRDEAKDTFETAGSKTIAEGEIVNDFLAHELVRCGVAECDEEATTYGLNLALRLARFLILEKT
jgi:SAM-dependent methyltransferase